MPSPKQLQAKINPGIVKPEDLHPNGFLLPQDQLLEVRQRIKEGRYENNKLSRRKEGYEQSVYIDPDSKKSFIVYMGQDNIIGRGGYGTVRLGQDLETGEWLAVKTQTLNPANVEFEGSEAFDEIGHECKMLGIVGKFGGRIQIEATGKDVTALQFEHGRDLSHQTYKKDKQGNYSRNDANIPLDTKLDQGLGAMLAIAELHNFRSIANVKDDSENPTDLEYSVVEHGIIHRDIKTANFMNHDGIISVVDFGLARVNKADGVKLDYTEGTKGFIAPEIIKDRLYSKNSDVFALGMMIAEMVSNEDSITGLGRFDESEKKKELMPDVFDESSQAFKSRNYSEEELKIIKTIQRMTSENPDHRPTLNSCIKVFSEVLTHRKEQKEAQTFKSKNEARNQDPSEARAQLERVVRRLQFYRSSKKMQYAPLTSLDHQKLQYTNMVIEKLNGTLAKAPIDDKAVENLMDDIHAVYLAMEKLPSKNANGPACFQILKKGIKDVVIKHNLDHWNEVKDQIKDAKAAQTSPEIREFREGLTEKATELVSYIQERGDRFFHKGRLDKAQKSYQAIVELLQEQPMLQEDVLALKEKIKNFEKDIPGYSDLKGLFKETLSMIEKASPLIPTAQEFKSQQKTQPEPESKPQQDVSFDYIQSLTETLVHLAHPHDHPEQAPLQEAQKTVDYKKQLESQGATPELANVLAKRREEVDKSIEADAPKERKSMRKD